MPVHVSSEIGRLRSVLVHTPGAELLAVTPATKEDFLYDDIIDVESAGREHRRFVAILERFAEVYQVRDLLVEALANPEAREILIRETMDVVPSAPLAPASSSELPADVLASAPDRGDLEEPGPLSRTLKRGSLPSRDSNLFFTRTTAMAVNRPRADRVDALASGCDRELLMRRSSRHLRSRQPWHTLRTGPPSAATTTRSRADVHVLRRDTVMIGFSERFEPRRRSTTSRRCCSSETGVENVIVVVMPAENTAIHLDMIFTQVDREQCVIFPPHFRRSGAAAGAAVAPRAAQLAQMPKSSPRSPSAGWPMEPIFCGGDRRNLQEREQWASGATSSRCAPAGALLRAQRGR
jgi:arginine deiminase